MTLKISDAELIQLKETNDTIVFLLDQSHLKPETLDLGYKDRRDLLPDVDLRIEFAKLVLLEFQGTIHVVKSEGNVQVKRI